ncbi:SHOCT domain-containing protein [Alcaligenes endophyticus]|uniref:SHOCT domain-containing protein n=1 Tax=Alcaligenes endophyticus TaxID=1929088 RepID=A0ABT8EIZ9_9BURK|nr:SHOCT domain-containing protein [Alcaligenes endophyticus]MCX5592542.1 SHOCT domain-containing protein [Alcaligenes endophyticus]MDN4121269.1 SHOCT domain-containing protein [Alcaligenes endophyticus]
MSVADELRKLDDLRKDGLLSNAEFERQKAVLLGEDRPLEDPQRQGRSGFSIAFRLMLGAVVVFVLLLLLGQCKLSEGLTEKQNARNSIKYCWEETERKALSPSEQRFTARTCEYMESEFEKKYGYQP